MPRPTLLLRASILVLAALPAAIGAQAQTETLRLTGLAGPVEILRDRWGIAHIFAQSEHDLFFAQGFNAARDRLFQLELWRRQATGTTAELLGRRELKRDIGARLLKYRGDLKQELNHYHPRGEAIIGAFVDGINAYVDEVARRPDLLPIELKMLGMTPGRWTPEIVVSRHNGLFGNLESEIQYAQAVALFGSQRVKDFVYFHPGEPPLEPDAAVDLSLIRDDLIEVYRAYRGPIRFTAEDVRPEYRAAGRLPVQLSAPVVADSPHEGDPASERRGAEGSPQASELGGVQGAPPSNDVIGSNNWVVSGRLTLSGRPIMANDPHRVQQAPSLRYWVHLVAPGWNVIGGGEPALPGVSIGHNEWGAWGLTVFGIDIEDLYVYDVNPSNPLQYRYRGGWESMTVVGDTIAVRGEAPVKIDLKYTRHGPVIFEDAARRKAYALRAGWLEPGTSPYLASLRLDQARTWEEFRDACAHSRTPAENMVWADINGNIGWQAVGLPPLRRGWPGLLPVPGDGRYEWDGYLPGKALPHVANPGKGFWGTANNNLVPEQYPYREALAWNWADPYRAARVEEVLASGRQHGLVDMMRLQHDELSIPARSVVPLLRDLQPADPDVARAKELLLGWDFVLDRGSVPAAIYVAWERRWLRQLRERSLPAGLAEKVGLSLSMKRAIDWLVAPDGRFGSDPVAGRDALLLGTLEQAVGDLKERLGPDTTRWQYGQPRFKHALIRHPLGQMVKEGATRFDVGPAPRGGYGNTVNSTGGGDNQTSGASFRIVADVADWDRTVGTNAPGQSGDPASPHYRDLFALWARGAYFPVLYTREKIETALEATIRLEPAGSTARR